MSDPFSVAGSTVGVISLGLQLCNQLVSYCRSVRDANQDLQNIATKAAGLRAPLKALRDILEEEELEQSDISPHRNRTSYLGDDMKDKIQAIVSVSVSKRGSARYGGGFGCDPDESAHIPACVSLYSVQHLSLIPHLVDLQKKTLEEMKNMSLALGSNVMISTSLAQATTSSLPNQPCKDTLALDPRERSTVVSRSPGHKISQQMISKKYSFRCRRLGLLISVSLSMTSGAGGLSIAPGLRFYAISPRESPIVDLINSRPVYFLDEKKWEMSYSIPNLRKWFSQAKAWPADASSEGETLLHHSYRYNQYLTVDSQEKNLKLVKFLVDNGDPVDMTTCAGETPLDTMFGFNAGNFEGSSKLIRFLIDRDSYFTQIPELLSQGQRQVLQAILAEDEDAVLLPSITKMILRESEADLRAALALGKVAANDTIQSMTLLELAVGWPKGVQILLEAGADVHQQSLATYNLAFRAAYLECYGSLDLFLKAGCLIDVTILIWPNCANARPKVLEELASRRKKLAILAKRHLPQQYLAWAKGDAVPDRVAPYFYNALIKRTIPVEPGLEPEYTGMSLYHVTYILGIQTPFTRISLETLELMYTSGFHDIDVLDSLGRTPLMVGGFEIVNRLQRARWLVSKGANLFRTLPQCSSTFFHIFGGLMGGYFPYRQDLLMVDAAGVGPFARFIMQAPIQDHCLCACSIGGCTPLLIALRRAAQHLNFGDQGGNFEFFTLFFAKATIEVFRSIIRFMTFGAVGLTHTCCRQIEDQNDYRFHFQEKEKEEILEIRQEEQALLEKFEGLISKFNTEFDTLNIPVFEFLEDHWYPQIMDFLSMVDVYDQDHVSETRALGVHLQWDQSCIPQRTSLLLFSKVWKVSDDI
ncbi:hypothetical protein BDW59DRAFT_161817 [Aspergillus cavernicola]|uniref:Ankyrin repeat-containing domain protein n=1 Tax=Aspergillus cavernicola TaxID=176166 RepID=A0ABR4IC97_9EURO